MPEYSTVKISMSFLKWMYKLFTILPSYPFKFTFYEFTTFLRGLVERIFVIMLSNDIMIR